MRLCSDKINKEPDIQLSVGISDVCVLISPAIAIFQANVSEKRSRYGANDILFSGRQQDIR